jgi:hypothetical protein
MNYYFYLLTNYNILDLGTYDLLFLLFALLLLLLDRVDCSL